MSTKPLPKPRGPLSDEQISMVLTRIYASAMGETTLNLCCGPFGGVPKSEIIEGITDDPFWQRIIPYLAYEFTGHQNPEYADRYVEDMAALLSPEPMEVWRRHKDFI